MNKRVCKEHAVMVGSYCSWEYNDDGSVKYWVMNVGMDLDGSLNSIVVIDFKPANGDLIVIRQTSKSVGGNYIWTKVEDE